MTENTLILLISKRCSWQTDKMVHDDTKWHRNSLMWL